MENRVIPFAKENGFVTYPGMENWQNFTTDELLAHNRAQIELWKLEGREIIDIGPAPGRAFTPWKQVKRMRWNTTLSVAMPGISQLFFREKPTGGRHLLSIEVMHESDGYLVYVSPPHADVWKSVQLMSATEVVQFLASLGCHQTDVMDALDIANPGWKSEHDNEIRRRRDVELQQILRKSMDGDG